MDRLTPALIGVLVAASLSFGQDNGSVHGTVADASGTPVKGATVYAHPLDRPMAGIVPHDISDERGSFSISKLNYGRYSVSAAKPDDGYPELNFASIPDFTPSGR
jgi:Carboxypeptidase regulatory-like domain